MLIVRETDGALAPRFQGGEDEMPTLWGVRVNSPISLTSFERAWSERGYGNVLDAFNGATAVASARVTAIAWITDTTGYCDLHGLEWVVRGATETKLPTRLFYRRPHSTQFGLQVGDTILVPRGGKRADRGRSTMVAGLPNGLRTQFGFVPAAGVQVRSLGRALRKAEGGNLRVRSLVGGQ